MVSGCRARTRRAGVDGGDPVRVSGVSDRGGKEGAGGTLTDASREGSTRDEPETGGVRGGHLNAAHARERRSGAGRGSPPSEPPCCDMARTVCRWWRGGCRFRKSLEKIGSCDLSAGRRSSIESHRPSRSRSARSTRAGDSTRPLKLRQSVNPVSKSQSGAVAPPARRSPSLVPSLYENLPLLIQHLLRLVPTRHRLRFEIVRARLPDDRPVALAHAFGFSSPPRTSPTAAAPRTRPRSGVLATDDRPTP